LKETKAGCVGRTCTRHVLISVYILYGPMALRSERRRPMEDAAPIPTRFSSKEVARIDRARVVLGMPSRSAFIREAALEKVKTVEESKVVEVRDVSEAEAMRLISQYLRKHPGVHYTSDLADEIGIELRVAFAAAERLIDEGRARVGED